MPTRFLCDAFSATPLLRRLCCDAFAVMLLLQRFCCDAFAATLLLRCFCCDAFAVMLLLRRFSATLLVCRSEMYVPGPWSSTRSLHHVKTFSATSDSTYSVANGIAKFK